MTMNSKVRVIPSATKTGFVKDKFSQIFKRHFEKFVFLKMSFSRVIEMPYAHQPKERLFILKTSNRQQFHHIFYSTKSGCRHIVRPHFTLAHDCLYRILHSLWWILVSFKQAFNQLTHTGAGALFLLPVNGTVFP